MDFNSIKTFLKVSELHSFSRAAAQLGYSQSAVSTQISRLENELGCPLFERMGRRIALTESGRSFLQYAQQITLLTEQMYQDFQGSHNTTGTLRIAMADSLCSSVFPPYLLTYQELYPEVVVRVHTGTTETMFNYLAHNEVDLVYTLDNRITRSDLMVHMEQVEPVYFCVSCSHPLAKQLSESPSRLFTWKELKSYPLYLTEAGISYRRNLELLLGNMGEELHPFIELGNIQVLLDLLKGNKGISFLPEFAIRNFLDKGSLVILPVEHMEVQVWRQLVYHKGKYVTPAMKGMIDLLRSSEEVPL